MNETITPRQGAIINILAVAKGISREEVASKLPAMFSTAKATLARDLGILVRAGLVASTGVGRSTIYSVVSIHPLLAYLDVNQYFAIEPDVRKFAKTGFDASIFEKIPGAISKLDQSELQTLFRSFSKTTHSMSPAILQRELERYVIELSWKSSKIEGNTYTLLETEKLIRNGLKAVGRTDREATMILNHKEAFKTIFEHPEDFRELSATNIIQLHAVLTKGLFIMSGLRNHAVGITSTTYRPPEDRWKIQEAFAQMIQLINTVEHPLEKAFLAACLVAYIQPFEDGNKRTSRMLSNAILLAYDHFPLSYRSVDENEYRNAIILFYETNNLYLLKKLFLEQYRFALRTYFPSQA